MITEATIKDITALNVLVNSAYRGESSKKGWTSEADLLGGVRTTETEINEMLQTPENTVLKYSEAENLMGCVLLIEKENTLYLGMLTVSPELQGSGIGKKLLKYAEVFAKENGKNKIEMTVISIRPELIAWYERHGYEKTGETKPFPMNDSSFGEPKQFLEFVVMEKAIN